MRVVLDMLQAAEAGGSGVLLVEGGPGTGKTRLLRESIDIAADRDFFVASGCADRPPDPVAVGARGRPVTAPSHKAVGKALVVLDDLHSAHPATLRRLWGLTRPLCTSSVVWVLARSTVGTGTGADRLFAHLARAGAVVLELRPLDDHDAAEMAADELGAQLEQELTDLATGANGNPLVIAELLAGLREERLIRIGSEAVSAVSPQLPERVRIVVRRWLRDLGPRVSRLLNVGAVLGRSFQVDTAASLLGEPPGAVLPELEAAVAAGILVADQNMVGFAQELVRRAIVADLPLAARQAVHRQAGEFLLQHGAPAAVAAKHMISGSGLTDPRALARLDQAARGILTTAPRTAAELAMSALTLTGPAHPGRVARMITAVEALIAAMRPAEAEYVARMALAGPVPARAAIRLRGLLASAMLYGGRASTAAAEASVVLAGNEVTGRARAEAEYVFMLGWWVSGEDRQQAQASAESSLVSGGRRREVAVTGALLVQAMTAWQEGRIRAALTVGREAVGRACADTCVARRAIARIVLAGMLISLGLLDQAREAGAGLPGEAMPGQFDGCGALSDILSGQLALAAGDSAGAAARTERGLLAAAERGCYLLSLVGMSVLATGALRAGDLRTATRHVNNCQALISTHGTGFGAVGCHLVSAQVAEAGLGPETAVPMVHALISRAAEDRGVLLADPAAAAWLVRFAQSQRDRERARLISAATCALALSEPGFAGVAAAAAHARGLLDGDAGALRLAAGQHAGLWARASAAEDLGVLLRGTDRFEAAQSLEEALAAYEKTGAVRDMRRVRRRLRGLGIRRRHFTYANRPRSGWASLTETERTVASLAAQGLTNQRIAVEMFLSAHTVAFHLRQIYRKLDIGSRVDLARILTERSRSADSPQAS